VSTLGKIVRGVLVRILLGLLLVASVLIIFERENAAALLKKGIASIPERFFEPIIAVLSGLALIGLLSLFRHLRLLIIFRHLTDSVSACALFSGRVQRG
jgi:hypothetical protein